MQSRDRRSRVVQLPFCAPYTGVNYSGDMRRMFRKLLGGGVILVFGKLGGGAGRRPNGECRLLETGTAVGIRPAASTRE